MSYTLHTISKGIFEPEAIILVLLRWVSDDHNRKYSRQRHFAVVAKIETGQAVKICRISFCRVCSRSSSASMAARRDLAIEIGFERMSEVENEILWLCEAAMYR